MDRTERFYRIDRLLRTRRLVTAGEFIEDLGISRATFHRDLQYMRDRLNAPIVWDEERGGYFLEVSASGQYELPGLWLNSSELHALLSIREVLKNIDPGILAPQIEPLMKRIEVLAAKGGFKSDAFASRVTLVAAGKRRVTGPCFEAVCSALVGRKRMRITHHKRADAATEERTVSPQRLVYYRDNWYLDAWCHVRNALRAFAVDAIRSASLLEEDAKEIPRREIEQMFDSGYGIFTGVERQWAVLRFNAYHARWVSDEVWHAEQQGQLSPDGTYVLRVPYWDERELMRDVLRYGTGCEVLEPKALREHVAAELRAAARQYEIGVGNAAEPAAIP